MRLFHAAGVLATTFLAVAAARLVTTPNTSSAITDDAHATESAGSISSTRSYDADSHQISGDVKEAVDRFMEKARQAANVTKRDVFDDEDTHYLKECENSHERGRCYMHEIVPGGSCFTPMYQHNAKTYEPDRGVVCHMLDLADCKIAESWVGFFIYPGTADTVNDPIWQYAQMVDVKSMYCWVSTFDQIIPKVEPHYWAIPHFWRPMPWWQAPGVLQQGITYDPKWDYTSTVS